MAMSGSIGRNETSAPKTDTSSFLPLSDSPGCVHARARVIRRYRWSVISVAALGWLVVSGGVASGQLGDSVFVSLVHPAIGYKSRPTTDAIARLNQRIQNNEVRLTFESGHGYLRSVLEALDVPPESQLAVFSKTSAQTAFIDREHPRTIFFNDSVAVAWTGGGFIELSAHDPQQGVIFYDLPQQPSEKPAFSRQDWCLGCHHNPATLGVPGLMVRSIPTSAEGKPLTWLGNYTSDHRSPFEQRWGGWYVTGKAGSLRHLGNVVARANAGATAAEAAPDLESLNGLSSNSYSAHSDISALMVFEHQVHMTNLLTRMGWQARVGSADNRTDLPRVLETSAREVVDYMLFVDEAHLEGPVGGTSGFADAFAARGVRDSKGRSLRQLDLQQRLMRYRCSYMIYTAAFDGLPADAREAIYRRMWHVLSGEEQGQKYAALSLGERQAIVEILRDTKQGLPQYFQPVVQ